MLDRLRFETEIQLLSETPGAAHHAAVSKAAQQAGPRSCVDRLKATRVAVIGAGLAGLAAALHLREKGANVTLYEARHKVGGRVASNKKFASQRIIEEGAELIGSFHTFWLNLALRYKLSVITRMEDGDYDRQGLRLKLALGGKELTNEEYFDLSEKLDAVLTRIADFADRLNFDPAMPWMHSNLSIYDNETVANALQQRFGVSKGSLLWQMVEHLLVNDEVAQLEDMNFLGLLCKVKAGQGKRLGRPFRNNAEDQKSRKMGYWEELEIFRCADGCGTMAEKMAIDLKDRLKVRINLLSPITQIHLTEGGVLIGVSKATSDGKIDRELPHFAFCDYVVFTAPPPVWEKVSVSTGGTLSRDKTRVTGSKAVDLKADIGLMRDGPAIKHFTVAKSRFWLSENPPAAPSGGTLKLGQIWEGTDNQTRTGASQDSVLAVFAGPLIPTPIRPGGMPFRSPAKDECTAELKRLYPKTYPTGARILFVDWPNMPFIKTGYASPSKGQVMTIGRKLAQPYRGRMLFAGEHTHMGFFGYMEGALRSGERAAAMLMNLVCGTSTTSPGTSAGSTMIA